MVVPVPRPYLRPRSSWRIRSPANGLLGAANSGHLQPCALSVVLEVVCLRLFAQTGARWVKHVPRTLFRIRQLAALKAKKTFEEISIRPSCTRLNSPASRRDSIQEAENVNSHANIDRVLSDLKQEAN